MYCFATHRESSVYQVEAVKSIGGICTTGGVLRVKAVFAEND
jgi:hypothetical protein